MNGPVDPRIENVVLNALSWTHSIILANHSFC